MTKGELISTIYRVLPYSDQVKNLDIDSEQDAVRFDWRGDRFRVGEHGYVEQVHGDMLSGSNVTILLQKLIRGD